MTRGGTSISPGPEQDAGAGESRRRDPMGPLPGRVGAVPVVEAGGVRKHFAGGVEVLRGIDLRLTKGEMVGLVGTSGAGKTTLLRLLNGALLPTAGELQVLGTDMTVIRGARLRVHRRRVATIAQQYGLVPRTSVLYNMLLGRLGQASLWHALRVVVAPSAAQRAAAELGLAELGLAGVLRQPIDLLSGGQQQRVAVARALLQDAELVLADEPVASVDQKTAHLILGVLSRLAAEEGRTVIVSLHQRDLALSFCTRLIALDRGLVTYDGPPDVLAWRDVYDV